MTVNSGTDRDVFITFIKQILVPNLWEGATVVMDNLPAHKVKEVSKLIEKAGSKLLYLSQTLPKNQGVKISKLSANLTKNQEVFISKSSPTCRVYQ